MSESRDYIADYGLLTLVLKGVRGACFAIKLNHSNDPVLHRSLQTDCSYAGIDPRSRWLVDRCKVVPNYSDDLVGIA